MVLHPQKSWRRPDQTLLIRASRLSVLLSLLPLFGIILGGCVVQYVLNGKLSDNMDWFVGSAALLILIVTFVAPAFNYLELTPESFYIRKVAIAKQIAWNEIEPDSFVRIVHTSWL